MNSPPLFFIFGSPLDFGVWNNTEATNLKAKDFQRRDLNNRSDK